MVNILAKKFAVVCHIHFEDVWENDIKPRLLNAWFNFDLYVTVTDFGDRTELVDNIILDFPNAKIAIIPNLGEDLRGFVYWTNYMTSNNIEYDYLLKIHTKKSNAKWMRNLMNALIPDYCNRDSLENMILKNSKMASASKYIMHKPKGNTVDMEYFDDICNMIHINPREAFYFVAGTMFWIRYDLVKKYLTKEIMPNEYFDAAYSKGHTKMHSMERVFGVIGADEDERIFSLSYDEYPIKKYNLLGNGVAICAIAKMENAYIREWVEHNKKLGFDRIYLYDNNDINGERFDDVIKEYIMSGYVKIINIRGCVVTSKESELCGQQEIAYMNCYNRFGRYHKWIAFIDIDEFVMMDDKFKNIKTFCNQRKFSKYAQIKLNWKCYGDNGLVYYEDIPVVERFTIPAPVDFIMHGGMPENRHVKCFVKTNKELTRIPVHFAIFKNDCDKTCDALGKEIDGPSPFNSDIVHECVWINHYNTKTIEEYLIRRTLRNRSTGEPEIEFDKRVEWFFNENEDTQEKRDVIEYFVSKKNDTEHSAENQNYISSFPQKSMRDIFSNKVTSYILEIGTKINPARFVPHKSKVMKMYCRGELFGGAYQEVISSIFYKESKWYLLVKDSAVSDNPQKIMTAIENVIDFEKNIGVYSPSAINVDRRNRSYTLKTGKLRDVDCVDDHIILINSSALSGIKRLDFSSCRSGYGFIEYICSLSKKNGFRNVVDDTVTYSVVGELRKSDSVMQSEKMRLYDLNKIKN